jgi:hypothetical protein
MPQYEVKTTCNYEDWKVQGTFKSQNEAELFAASFYADNLRPNIASGEMVRRWMDVWASTRNDKWLKMAKNNDLRVIKQIVVTKKLPEGKITNFETYKSYIDEFEGL